MSFAVEFPELANFLGAWFPDADLEGQSDLDIIIQFSKTKNRSLVQAVYKELCRALVLPELDVESIVFESNRFFSSSEDSRKWLLSLRDLFLDNVSRIKLEGLVGLKAVAHYESIKAREDIEELEYLASGLKDMEVSNYLGGLYFRDLDIKKALMFSLPAAEEGFVESQYRLGCIYLDKTNKLYSAERGKLWLSKAVINFRDILSGIDRAMQPENYEYIAEKVDTCDQLLRII